MMKLKELKIRNFRGYKDLTKVNVRDLTTIIGKNDIGKSTIMEALEIFFNNKTVSIDKEDLAIDHDTDDLDIEITCVFDDVPKELSIDSSSITSLEKEFLLNYNGLLEIKKTYTATAAKPKAKTTIICNHPINKDYDDLLMLKQAGLKKRAIDLSISEDNYDPRNNVSIRQAIYDNCNNIELMQKEIEVDKDDSKKIYTSLENYLPAFALFQSDRASLDSDSEITDPMKVAVQQALSSLNDEITAIKNKVQEKTLDTAMRTLEKLKEMDENLADTLEPEFKTEPKFDTLFKLTIKSDDGISLNKRGSGVRRLILLNFFRAEAERRLKDSERNENMIYAIEEPETALHPIQQKILMKSLKELSEQHNVQILLTTHNPALAEMIPLESLRLVKEVKGKVEVTENSPLIYDEIINELGIFPKPIDNTFKGVILVEGKDDITFLNHLSKVFKDKKIIEEDFDSKNITIIPTGGCNNLKFWAQAKLIEGFNIPWAVFLDSDSKFEGDTTDNIRFIKKYTTDGNIGIHTVRREVENYLSSKLFNDEIIIEEYNDAKKEVKKFKKNNRIKEKGSPIELYWRDMNYEHINEVGLYIDNDGTEKNELIDIIEELIEIV